MPYPFGMDTHICRVILIERTVSSEIDITSRVARTLEIPGSARSPTVAHGRIKLERTVLNEFGIESSVSGIADILEEDTNEFVTDFQSSFRRFLRKNIDIKAHSSA